jgi:predicted GNAT family acetyltransferase
MVAESAGRLAGVRAFMRWRLDTTEGDELSCVRAVDTATHPEFQGRGVFRDLTMTAVEQARSEGVDLIFNTPNEKSAPGYLKMGWSEVGQIRPRVRPRLGRTVVPGDSGIVDPFDVLPTAREFAPQPVEDREQRGLRTPRTIAYQKWRYTGHPTARYGWVGEGAQGAVVRGSVRRGRTELLITELWGGGATLLRSIARAHRARYMAAAFTDISPEAGSARSAWMLRPPGVDGLRLVANDLAGLDIDVFDLASWDLSLGDLELL